MVNIKSRIIPRIKLISKYLKDYEIKVSEYIKDYRIKSSKPAAFIKCHTIFLSLLIILIGIWAIYLSYSEQIVPNIITIDPRSATNGTVTNNTN